MPNRFFLLLAALAVGFFAARLLPERGGAPSWWPDRERDKNVRYFRDVLQVVKENYYDAGKAGYKDLTRGALKGMVGGLDPHSEYLDADAYSQTEEDLSSEFGGVGIQVEEHDGRIKVVTAVAGTPAEAAGVRRGDQLVKVDGRPLETASIDKAIKLIRGKPDTEVVLTLFRPGLNKELDFNLRRQLIVMPSVRNVMIRPDGLGYLQITQFSDPTAGEFVAALEELEKQGMRALVIDLRNNPGGLLEAAVGVCDPFFRTGELVAYTQGRLADSKETFLAEGKHAPRAYPIAVLVNGGTASAAEIVTGALQDTRRAVVVGERSYGKGSVQSVIQLDNGEGLRLTTARYYTPSGRIIHGQGLQPDAEVVISEDDESKLRMQQSRTDLGNLTEFTERFGFTPIPDVQLNTATEVLTGVLAAGASK